jgi:hypothetical protein
LRWLVAKGCVQCAIELQPKGANREFRSVPMQDGNPSVCVVITPYGRQVLDLLNQREQIRVDPPGAIAGPVLRPHWDRARFELRFGDSLVKRFRLPAPNQKRILAAFEEEHWPPRIDDPLPPHPEIDSKRRLHHTLIALNRNQKQRLIQFHGDGTGQGVCWTAR